MERSKCELSFVRENSPTAKQNQETCNALLREVGKGKHRKKQKDVDHIWFEGGKQVIVGKVCGAGV